MPGVWFLWSKKKIFIFFQKEKGNTFTLLIIFIVRSLKKSKIAQIYYSAGINVQSPQSESTPRRLTLHNPLKYGFCKKSLFLNENLTIWTLFSSLWGTSTLVPTSDYLRTNGFARKVARFSMEMFRTYAITWIEFHNKVLFKNQTSRRRLGVDKSLKLAYLEFFCHNS